MIVLRAFKTELDLNNAQKTACAGHAGAARWAYNWGLARKIEAYQAGQKVPTAIDLHQATSLLAKTKSVVVLEDLNVSGMMKNHHLAQAIADVGFHEFRRQLTYKGMWNGCEVLVADRFYPSSKRCSRCGNVKAELDLSERVYECEVCGLIIDRDLNAAFNLEHWPTASSAERHACGEGVRPGRPAVLVEAGTEPRSTLCRFVYVSENGTDVRVDLGL